MMKYRWLGFLGVSGCLGLTLAACSSSDSGGDTPGPSAGGSASAGAAGSGGAAGTSATGGTTGTGGHAGVSGSSGVGGSGHGGTGAGGTGAGGTGAAGGGSGTGGAGPGAGGTAGTGPGTGGAGPGMGGAGPGAGGSSGATGTGGSAGMGAGGAKCQPKLLYPPAPTSGSATLYCPFSAPTGGKDISCDPAAGEYCCETAKSEMKPSYCAKSTGTASPCTMVETSWQCERSADCSGGEVCCGTGTVMTSTSGPDCADFVSKFGGTKCAATCAATEFQVCNDSAGCPAGSGCFALDTKGNHAGSCKPCPGGQTTCGDQSVGSGGAGGAGAGGNGGGGSTVGGAGGVSAGGQAGAGGGAVGGQSGTGGSAGGGGAGG